MWQDWRGDGTMLRGLQTEVGEAYRSLVMDADAVTNSRAKRSDAVDAEERNQTKRGSGRVDWASGWQLQAGGYRTWFWKARRRTVPRSS